jgi:hypothetical protein
MALFVDGNPSQLTDLANYESAIVEVAATEGIDLTAKGTVAALEIGLDLQRFLSPELCTRLTHGLERCGAQATWNP